MRHPVGVPMEQESESEDDEDRVPKGSMVLNELAAFDDDQPVGGHLDDENLLADDQPEIQVLEENEEEPNTET